MPLVSICIVAYNLEKYIGACIESALKQDFEDYEIVLVDNGSDDCTVQICQEYAEKNSKIRFFALEKPTRAVRGHIEAVKQANGKYIHLIDGDDCVRENYLVELNKVICEEQPDLIIGTFECIVEEGATNYRDVSIYGKRINHASAREAKEYIFGLPYFNPFVWRFVAKRELFQMADFEEDVKYLVGIDGLKGSVLLLGAESIYYCSVPFYYYRRRLGSTVMSVNHRYTIDFLKLLFAFMEKYLELSGGDTEKKAWLYRLGAKKLEWNIKLFFTGADCLSEDELNEAEGILEERKDEVALLYEYPSEYLHCFADRLIKGFEQKPLRKLLEVMDEAFMERLFDVKRSCYIFPTGTAAFGVSRFLERHEIELKGYLDNDEKKNNTFIYGVPCESFSSFLKHTEKEERNENFYIIATMYEEVEKQIEQQLLTVGVNAENIIKRKWI